MKTQLFSNYIQKNHIQLLDGSDKIDGIAVNDLIVSVKINGEFYDVGLFDNVEHSIRLCGQLIGIDHWIDDCNIFIENVDRIGSTETIECITENIIQLIELQDQYIENDLHWTKCRFELTVSL